MQNKVIEEDGSEGELRQFEILHSCQIQDSSLIPKCVLARPKYACTEGYSVSRDDRCTNVAIERYPAWGQSARETNKDQGQSVRNIS